MWTVMIVEDEVFVRESVKELIAWEELGFQLTAEASDGLDALEQMQKHPPDLVITDIVMPRMDGVELLKAAREAGFRSKFVMLTCMSDFEYMQQAIKYGASDYILKLSMSVNDLRATLQTINQELRSNQGAPTLPPANKTSHPEINKIIEYIELNYKQDITVKSLSQYVMMGENYVSRLFKQKTGKSLISHLHEVRIHQAKHELLHTDDSINEIGYNVGFVNSNYFIKIFKRETGETPGQYRQRYSL